MLIVVLVLALLGLWTPAAVALVWAMRRYEVQDLETVAGGGLRLECAVCGAHYFRRTSAQDELRERYDAHNG